MLIVIRQQKMNSGADKYEFYKFSYLFLKDYIEGEDGRNKVVNK